MHRLAVMTAAGGSAGRCAGVLALLAAIGLGACTPYGIATTVGARSATAALEERGFAGNVDDARIRLWINHYWLQHSEEMYTKVGLNVHEGRVLVTGALADPALRQDAVRLARQVEGVKEVIDEIHPVEGELDDMARDASITARLSTQLTLDPEVSAINYAVTTTNRVIYLIGIAEDEAELRHVIHVAGEVPYARRVVSHVILKDDPIRTITPPPRPAPPGGPPPEPQTGPPP
ncbi:MAG: BON domain-containing protein [Kiloniellales bacterium]